MSTMLLPATDEINNAFSEEIAALGGSMKDVFDDGVRLFARAVLPAAQDVRPGDRICGGVALRTCADEILIHPYIYREVCKNGAIQAQSMQTRRLARASFSAATNAVDQVLVQVREAVQACAVREVFAAGVQGMRTATERDADYALTTMAFARRMPRNLATKLMAAVLDRFESQSDRTMYGLMNAITSLARDTEDDPERRWELEELGGGIPALLRPRPRPAPARRSLIGM